MNGTARGLSRILFQVERVLSSSSSGGCRYCLNRPLICRRMSVRTVLRIHDPMARVVVDKKVKADTKPHKSTSDFNMIMGDITIGNRSSRIAVEGSRLVEDAVSAGLELEKLFLLKSLKTLPPGLSHFLEEEKEQLLSGFRIPEIHRVGQKAMETWSAVTTPPGVVGVFRKPDDNQLSVKRDSVIPLTVICDNIREPGNLGSILRSASGAGCDDIYLTKGCVDPWNMKVLRGGCGAHFHLPMTSNLSDQMLDRIIETKIQKLTTSTGQSEFAIFICDSNVEDKRLDLPITSYRTVNYKEFLHSFLVIGGETTGVTDNTLTILKLMQKKRIVKLHRIRIPLANSIESLNAANAFGIVVFEIVRQLNEVSK